MTEELEIVRSNPRMSATELADILGRSKSHVYRLRKKIRIHADQRYLKKGTSKYTEKEDEFILSNGLSNKEKAEKLGISLSALTARKDKLKRMKYGT